MSLPQVCDACSWFITNVMRATQRCLAISESGGFFPSALPISSIFSKWGSPNQFSWMCGLLSDRLLSIFITESQWNKNLIDGVNYCMKTLCRNQCKFHLLCYLTETELLLTPNNFIWLRSIFHWLPHRILEPSIGLTHVSNFRRFFVNAFFCDASVYTQWCC
jgi:hypothetical protein